MGHYEDTFFEIYHDIQRKGLRNQFDSQVKKMKSQEKHRFKSPKELWVYAHNKVTSSLPTQDNLDY